MKAGRGGRWAAKVDTRAPKAHWLLLGVAILVLLAELALHGLLTRAAPTSDDELTDRGGVSHAAAAGAPVHRIDADGTLTGRRMPAKTVALVFEGGPHPVWTPQILDVLARYHANATFFQVGSRVNEHPELSRRVRAAGHEIGTSTFTHAELDRMPAWQRDIELTLSSDAIAAAAGVVPTLLNPPYGSVPPSLGTDALRQVGAGRYLVVLPDHTVEHLRGLGAGGAEPAEGAGAVVAMRDWGWDRSRTVAALGAVIPRLQAQGYRFVTISEGLGLTDAPVAAQDKRLRGHALRFAQVAGAWLADAMTWLALAAVGLTGLRLSIQIWGSRVHTRRASRSAPGQRRYLGPVSVIVPAYNEAANIAATVRSLVASDYPRLEVIVVDDGSTDGTAEIVAEIGLPSVYVVRQENAGKPAALNNGVRHARGDLLVLVDGDTVFEPDAIGRLVQPLRDPRVGAVAGNTKVANRRGFLGRWQHLEYVIGFNLDRRMFDVGQCIATVPGAIGAFRRTALRDVGGVSAQTLAEDTDLTMAILRAGWQVVYAPDAIAWTEAPASLRQLWRQRYRWCYGTMQAAWKHRSALTERGAAGRFGRRGLTYLLLFQVLLPLSAPMADVFLFYGLLFMAPIKIAAVWGGFMLAQLLVAAYALHLDRERYGVLWSMPFQQIIYRQLIYLVVFQSIVMALLGGRLGWHRMVRTGAARAHAEAARA
jgi:cellulose synthase/poly-beta-1,6-N-acetylglucosamine synthase-like glycosyltransferase/peptidoglycan/xylan/chitin deacetylase (PgdA/CDA1 family)